MASKVERMEVEDFGSDVDSGLEVGENGKTQSQTRMDFSDYELGYRQVQRESGLRAKEVSAWEKSTHQTNIQPDGEKAKNNHAPKKEMYPHDERWKTFKNFPAVALVKRLCDSGYYFTGKNDTTVCFSCGAEVTKWEEHDNPSNYHEANCSFNNPQNNEKKEFEGLQETAMEDMLSSEFCESILDAPITTSNTNSFPEPLRPEMAEISVSPNLSIVSKSNVTSHSDVEIQREDEKALASRNHHTFLNNVAEFEPLHSEQSQNYNDEGKDVVKKLFIARKEKPLVVLGVVNTNTHQQLLLNLDLYSEEDRRKTFSANSEAMKNFQSIVNYKELAQDGFFYLGNDVRTQCFSCQKVFKVWVAQDEVNQVHKECVPYCRMANGNDPLNVPLPKWQGSSPSSYSSLDNSSSHSEGYPNVAESSHDNSRSLSFVPSHKAQSIVTHAPVYTKPAMNLGHQSALTMESSVQDKKYRKMHPVKSKESPLDLSRQNQALSIKRPHIGIPLISPIPDKNTDKSDLQTVQSRVVKIPHNMVLENLGNNQARNEEETMPSILIKRPSSRTSNFPQQLNQVIASHSSSLELQDPGASSFPSNLLTSPTMNEDIKVPHQEEQQFHGIQPQDEGETNPNISISNQILSPSVAEPEPSHHLGQTTLYNATSTNDLGIPGASAGAVFTSAPSSIENPLRTTFPCLDPARPDLANAISRQETFDYTWPSGNMNASIDELARAGFYHTGGGDHLKCWYCNGGISNWNREDDPWIEHARIFPECEFVLQQKGPDFVSDVSSRYRNFETRLSPVQFNQSNSSSSSNSPIPGSPRGLPSRVLLNIIGNQIIGGNPFTSPGTPPRVIDPRVEEERKKRELELAMASESVMYAVEMGFDMRKIRKILKRKISSSGSSFSTPEALMEGLLEASANMSESSESEDEQGPSTSAQPTSSSTTTSTSSNQHLFATQVPYEKKPSPLEGAEDLDPRALDNRLREYQQEKRCKVCLDRDADVAFDPCGHLCTCVQCAENLRNCPLCRKKIKRSMRVYTS